LTQLIRVSLEGGGSIVVETSEELAGGPSACGTYRGAHLHDPGLPNAPPSVDLGRRDLLASMSVSHRDSGHASCRLKGSGSSVADPCRPSRCSHLATLLLPGACSHALPTKDHIETGARLTEAGRAEAAASTRGSTPWEDAGEERDDDLPAMRELLAQVAAATVQVAQAGSSPSSTVSPPRRHTSASSG
jgi:hypothetical protein